MELKQVAARRSAVHEDSTKLNAEKPLEAGLVGLAFSGGGIRSATFNLGILQALGRLKLLTRLDYLSTVSGGGYIGAWLAAWIHRAEGTPKERVEAVQQHLNTEWTRDPKPPLPVAEPEPVQHLREHSRYLALNSGVLTLDMWSLLSIYLRNVFINLLVVVPLLLTVVFGCRWLIAVYAQPGSITGMEVGAAWVFLVLLLLMTLLVRLNVLFIGGDAATARARPTSETSIWAQSAGPSGFKLHVVFVLLSLLIAYAGVWVPQAILQPAGESPRAIVAASATGVAFGFQSSAFGWTESARPVVASAAEGIAFGVQSQSLTAAASSAAERVAFGVERQAFGSTESERLAVVSGAAESIAFGARGKLVAFAAERAVFREDALVWRLVWRTSESGEWLARRDAGLEEEGVGEKWLPFVLIGRLFAALFLFCALALWVIVWAFARPMAFRRAFRRLLDPLDPFPGRPLGAALSDWAGEVLHRLTGGLRRVVGVAINGLVLGALYVALVKCVLFYDAANHPALYVTFGPPLFILALLVAGYLEVAIAGWTMDEFEREWRSRIAALLFRVGFVWMLLFASIVYLPWGLRELGPALFTKEKVDQRAAPWVALVGWLLTTLGGYSVARRATAHSSRRLLIAVRVVPVLFLVGLFGVGSELSLLVVRAPDDLNEPNYLSRLEQSGAGNVARAILWWSVGTAVAVLFIPATLFSLHSLYMNRLTRCYLGASRTGETRDPKGPGLEKKPRRRPNRFNGFDPRDDVPLTDLRGASDAPYPGPYPLVNTALNLVGGEDLAYQDRKGSSFVLTPDYCGSEETGYARLDDAPDERTRHNLTLGRAMTISGAAIDPNMKDHQSGPLTAFLTILNARLGWWIESPAAANADRTWSWYGWAFWEWPGRALGWFRRRIGVPPRWTAKPPMLGAYRYLRELFGYTIAKDNYVHLSDGGHFDASGAYELIRRRCRYVIAIDAAEDTDDASENLANLIRLVRADFGIDIEIDTSPLRKDDKGISRAHCAIGAIRYDQVDPTGVVGTFVFVRSSLTGDESADLRNYANTKPPFPHHSTADQFFDDAQFESYRRLGEHIGRAVFTEAADEIELPQEELPAERYGEFNRQWFANLRRQWAARANTATGYLASCRDYLKATEHLRDTPTLHPLTRTLFPELAYLPPPRAGDVIASTIRAYNVRELALLRPPRAGDPVPRPVVGANAGGAGPLAVDRPAGPEEELHAVDYLLQVMELAWVENDLENRHADALNRGWMNVFRRWTSSKTFHHYWPVLRGQYSRGFVRFCDRALNLDRLPVQWYPVRDMPDSLRSKLVAELDAEFYREWSNALLKGWPKVSIEERQKYLTRAVAAAEPGWLLTVGRGGDKPGPLTEWGDHVPLGLVVVFDPKQLDPAVAFAETRELLVWVRGGHRTLGLARDSVPTLMRAHIRKTDKRLLVRYPVLEDNAAGRLQQRAWEWFFFDLGFVRDADNERAKTGQTRLVLHPNEPV